MRQSWNKQIGYFHLLQECKYNNNAQVDKRTMPNDNKFNTGPSTRNNGCTQASVSDSIKEEDVIPATVLAYK
jgi:hypothetical protein